MIVTKNSNDHEICTQIPKKYAVTTNFGANGKKNRRDKEFQKAAIYVVILFLSA